MKVKFNDSIAHFLSRLCGGEEEFYPKKSSYSKAYQVKIPFLPYIFCLDITD